MAWNDAPPTDQELSALKSSSNWDSHPPSQQELAALGAHPPERSPFALSAKGLAKGAINSLPALGGIAGGIVGNVPGAGYGGAAGEAAKNALNATFFPEDAPQTREEMYTKPLKAGATMAAAEMGGQSLGALMPAAKAAAPSQADVEKVNAVIHPPAPLMKEVSTGILDASGNPITKQVLAETGGNVADAVPAAESAQAGATSLPGKLVKYLGNKVMNKSVTGSIVKDLGGDKIIDKAAGSADWISNKLSMNPEAFGKFAPVLKQAAQRGPTALAATSYVLQQSNPEYADAWKKAQETDHGQP